MEHERFDEVSSALGETKVAGGLFARLVSLLPDALMLVANDSGVVTALSDEAVRLVGEIDNLDGLQAECTSDLQEVLGAALGTNQPVDRTLHQTSGRRRIRFTPVLNDGDLGLFRLTDVESALEREHRRDVLRNNLERAERFDAAGRVAGVVAHEFNNILSVILNHADLLREGGDLQGEALEDADQIREAAMEAAELTKRLLLFGRNDMSKPQFVSVQKSLAKVVEEFHSRYELRVETDIDVPSKSSVWVHPVRWSEALLHLLENAMEASDGDPPGLRARKVEVGQDHPAGIAPGNYIEFVISDEGAGMSEAIARRAFEPFFSTKDGLGAGLGLSVAYGIATSLGGHIKIDSTKGDGTDVTLVLPEHDDVDEKPDERPVSKEKTSSVDAQARTILVVEDEPGVLRAVQRILSAKGYELLTASSGTEALSVIEEHEGAIDLLLTDVVMPGMSGVQLAKRVMRNRSDIKVLYMSGYTESALSLDQLVAGKTDLILKPFTATDLLEVVEFQLQS